MQHANWLVIILVGSAVGALIIFLIWKNKKDREIINPDAEDSVEETIMDQERRADEN